jgi:dTDP-4-dehydrorhamnose reductase
MKILVTGANGQVGSELTSCGIRRLVDPYREKARVQIIIKYMNSPRSLQKFGLHTLIHTLPLETELQYLGLN